MESHELLLAATVCQALQDAKKPGAWQNEAIGFLNFIFPSWRKYEELVPLRKLSPIELDKRSAITNQDLW